MIQITKGNPTSEEIAALVAVLMLANGTHPTAAPPAPREPMATSSAVPRSHIRCAEPA